MTTPDMAADHLYRSADGLNLYCRVYPARTAGALPVLCLPGLTRNSRDFAALARHLQPQHEVLAADLRGRGRSDWDPDPARYQLPTYVQDMWALLQSRCAARVVVIGTSLGALMAMVMAALQPARIAAVVLNDAGPELDPAGVRRIAAYAGKLPPVSSWAQAAAQTKSVYAAALPGLSDAEWLEYARRGYREDARGVPVPDMDPAISKAFSTPSAAPVDLWPLFAQLGSMPMLVIRGAHSDILSAATLERMAREKPDLMRVSVENRGHTPLLDEPQCLSAIDLFLAQHGRA
ncbi:MAG TPA: alpha/beta fold hydrolase [Steroidobacteraceae bacterium]|nr:alpha/beta fold hydrolase [Steroidobacteraceae bacterium]